MYLIARWHERHPRWMFAALTAITLMALLGISRLQFDSDPRVMFRSKNAGYEKLREFYQSYGEDDQDCVALIEGDALQTIEGLKGLRAFVSVLNADSSVDNVASIFSARRGNRLLPLQLIGDEELKPEAFPALRQAMASHPVIRGQLLSADGRATIVSARLKGSQVPVEQLEGLLQRFEVIAESHLKPVGLRCAWVGHPSARVNVLQTLQTEVMKFAGLGAIVSGVVAFIVFRNFTLLGIAMAGPNVGVLWTLGAMGWCGIKIDPLLVILPTLLFVVGFTDAFHLLTEMQAGAANGLHHRKAAVEGVRIVGPACALTALTTGIGFASLCVANTECVQRFGLTSALGTVLTFFAIQGVVPCLASSFMGKNLGGKVAHHESRISQAIYRILGWFLDRYRATAAVGVLVVAGCLISSLQLQADLKWLETLPRDSDVVKATERCDRLFGGVFSAYVVVRWPEGVGFRSPAVMQLLDEVHQTCDAQFPEARSFSIRHVLESLQTPNESLLDQVRHLKRMPDELLNCLLHSDDREAVIRLHVPDAGARTLTPRFESLREKLKHLESLHPGARFELTGTVVVAAENVYQIIRDLSYSLSLASVVIFLVMVGVFRSLGLGLLTIVPNVLPQTLTAFVLVVTGEPLTITTVLTFSLCLGLSVDDTVHFLMRFMQERRSGCDDKAALLSTFRGAGRTMLATSVVLIGGFAAMYVSVMPGIRWFSILSCTTLVAALIGDLVMLPALLLCFPMRRSATSTSDPFPASESVVP